MRDRNYHKHICQLICEYVIVVDINMPLQWLGPSGTQVLQSVLLLIIMLNKYDFLANIIKRINHIVFVHCGTFSENCDTKDILHCEANAPDSVTITHYTIRLMWTVHFIIVFFNIINFSVNKYYFELWHL